MGLIKAALGAASGVLADQWKEYFYCEALPGNVMAVKGRKKVSGRSSNSGSDNIISNGSVIAVADGQCMLIVEQGKVVDLCAEPGEYTYDSSTEPSVFSGDLGSSIAEVFKNVCKRFTFGGEAPKDQRIYYFNTKEMPGMKYGTPNPVPFRVVDEKIGLDVDIAIRCFGEYSVRISNPLLFYTNVCGNVIADYTVDRLESQMRTELLTALQPSFARISDKGVRYSALPAHTGELADALNEELSGKWRDLRGIEIVSFGVSSVKASEEDEAMIKEAQRKQAAAMQDAAKNEGGAAMAFMGMNMAQNAGGVNAQNLYQMGAQQAQSAPAAPAGDSWKCACGSVNTGKFCPKCGAKKPEAVPAGAWKCACGSVNTGNFCPQCGAKKPAAAHYRCAKCGWEPADPANPPKFCPECGDPFTDEDKI